MQNGFITSGPLKLTTNCCQSFNAYVAFLFVDMLYVLHEAISDHSVLAIHSVLVTYGFILLREVRQSPNDKCCMIPLIWCAYCSNVQRNRMYIPSGSCQFLRGEGNKKWLVSGCTISSSLNLQIVLEIHFQTFKFLRTTKILSRRLSGIWDFISGAWD